MTQAATPKMSLAFTRGEMKRLHEEIGDIPKSHAGPKLLQLYRHLDALLEVEWNGKRFKQQQRRVCAPMSDEGDKQ